MTGRGRRRPGGPGGRGRRRWTGEVGAELYPVGDHGGGTVGADGGEQDPLPAGRRDLVVANVEAEVPASPQQPESTRRPARRARRSPHGRRRTRGRRAGGSAPGPARAGRRPGGRPLLAAPRWAAAGGASAVARRLAGCRFARRAAVERSPLAVACCWVAWCSSARARRARVRAEDFGQRADGGAGLLRAGVVREQLGGLGFQRGGAARFEPDDGHPRVQPRLQGGQGPGHAPFGVLSWPVWTRSGRSSRLGRTSTW